VFLLRWRPKGHRVRRLRWAQRPRV
jgi:hypothetical protein